MGKDCKCKNVDEQKNEKKHRHSDEKHKHSDEKHKHSDEKCCVSSEKSINCCNPAYQRLASIRTSMLLNSINALQNEYNVTEESFTDVKSRTGQDILLPIKESGAAYDVRGLEINRSEEYSEYVGNKAVPKKDFENAFVGYLLANKIKYAKWEECPQRDQVYGWYVNTNNNIDCHANVQLFQPYNNVPVNVTLINLWDSVDTTYSCYKNELLNLLELTNKALSQIGGSPKTEGNIVVVKDKKHKWLLLVAEAGTNVNVCDEKTQYVVFGVILC